ncbi:hypothetical protein SeMB42_g04301 [Synchytrium endobioticum]|uniref:Uncharacterized protein n=1 Tax=Synchytrium endobioticum TaxID=286115 RepID=A0A507CZ87_9FUNG|nr:hypothetical protein SeLEV6574_g08154 [Synchytrium endobioticum]TPX44492.1 hypothetical protein SeMB42_g04301 [Synchytrium endobioticum]
MSWIITIPALMALLNPVFGYTYNDNVVLVRGMPYGGSCTPRDGGDTWYLNFNVKSKGSQPNGDDSVKLTLSCQNGQPVSVGSDWYNAKPAVFNGAVTFTLADDISAYGGSVTCPRATCKDAHPFKLTAVDKNKQDMLVVGDIVGKPLKCPPGNSVNLVQVNGDSFCWGKAPKSQRSVSIWGIVNCGRPTTVLPTITAKFNGPISVIENANNAGSVKTDTLTWTVKPGEGTTWGVLEGGSCNVADYTGHGTEVKGSELKVVSCTATVANQSVPCTYGLENVGGNTSFYEWLGTGPDPLVLTP